MDKDTSTNLPIENKPKLVRDRIPELIEKSGNVKAITKVLGDKEYGESLVQKLHEETEELDLAIKEKTNQLEELADILELLKATAEYLGTTIEEIEKQRAEKEQRRGGFKKRLMLLGKENM